MDEVIIPYGYPLNILDDELSICIANKQWKNVYLKCNYKTYFMLRKSVPSTERPNSFVKETANDGVGMIPTCVSFPRFMHHNMQDSNHYFFWIRLNDEVEDHKIQIVADNNLGMSAPFKMLI